MRKQQVVYTLVLSMPVYPNSILVERKPRPIMLHNVSVESTRR
jgi:hypothetical protein